MQPTLHPSPSSQTSERILVIRLGALGDLVLCFQAFQDIRSSHPAAEIALLTMPAFAAFAGEMPWFDKVLIDQRAPIWRPDLWAALLSQIYKYQPTRIYDLQGKSRQNLLYFGMGGPLGPEWSGAAPFCSYPRLWPPAPGMHFTDFIAAQLRLANVPEAGTLDLAWLDASIAEFALPPRYALLVPGCGEGRTYKRWPPARYAELADRLQKMGIASVAVGTEADEDALRELRQHTAHVKDLSGQTSLLQLAGLARHASVVVGNDTGPVHLAAAVGAPTLALMSERVDPGWSAPWGARARYLQGHPLKDLPQDKVFLALLDWLDHKA